MGTRLKALAEVLARLDVEMAAALIAAIVITALLKLLGLL